MDVDGQEKGRRVEDGWGSMEWDERGLNGGGGGFDF